MNNKKFNTTIEMRIYKDRKLGYTMKELEDKYGCNRRYVDRLVKKYDNLWEDHKDIQIDLQSEVLADLCFYADKQRKTLIENFQKLLDIKDVLPEEDLIFASVCIAKKIIAAEDLVNKWDNIISLKKNHPEYLESALEIKKKFDKRYSIIRKEIL